MYESEMVSLQKCPNREAREQALEEAGYNVFSLSASDVYVDLLTDSGTGTMSTDQWAAMIRGDEAYAGSESFTRLAETVSEILGFDHVVPAHQGRGAEHLLYDAIIDDGDWVPANTHFDTTRAHVTEAGGTPADCPTTAAWNADSDRPFKGNLNIESVQEHAAEIDTDRIPAIVVTITNNSLAGQPVSIDNLRHARALADELDALLVIDGCRFAENAWFIKQRESEFANTPINDIVTAQLSFADAVVVSGKKDGLSNIGGFVATNDTTLYHQLRERAVLYEGFYTYGGMAGRDLAALAVGLREAIDPAYLKHRIGQVQTLADLLADRGVPVYRPAGGHAVYIDAEAVLPQISPEQFPGQALVCAAYRYGGVRTVELGSFAFPGSDRPELVRLAVPRRRYHHEHFEYVADVFETVMEQRSELSGFEVVSEPERQALRHFTADLRPIK